MEIGYNCCCALKSKVSIRSYKPASLPTDTFLRIFVVLIKLELPQHGPVYASIMSMMEILQCIMHSFYFPPFSKHIGIESSKASLCNLVQGEWKRPASTTPDTFLHCNYEVFSARVEREFSYYQTQVQPEYNPIAWKMLILSHFANVASLFLILYNICSYKWHRSMDMVSQHIFIQRFVFFLGII